MARETLKQREAQCTARVRKAGVSYPCERPAEVTVRGQRYCRVCAPGATPLADQLEQYLAHVLVKEKPAWFNGVALVREVRRLEAAYAELTAGQATTNHQTGTRG